jgi:drug/metabolite transporter (DMT)-like permease
MKKSFTAASLKAGIFLGVILFLGFATQTVGLKYTSATRSGFITGSLVVMVPIFQTIIFRKAPTKGALLGTALVFIGILFLSSGEGSVWNLLGEFGKNFNLGDLLTLICAGFFALHVVYIGIITPKYDFLELLFLQIATAAVLSFIASFIFSSLMFEPLHVEFTGNLILGILYTSILG